MNIKLLIENQQVDLLADGGFTLQVNSNVAGSVEDIVTSRSFTLICPYTTTNQIIFQHLDLVSKVGSWLTDYKNAVVQVDGLQIFKGKAILLKIGENGYEIALTFGELTALAALILDKRKISELGFTEIFKDWFINTPFDTTKKTIGFYNYDFGILGRSYMNNSYCVQFQHLISKISEFYGLDIQTPDLTEDYLILTQNLNARRAENPIVMLTMYVDGPLHIEPNSFYQSELGIDYDGANNDFKPNATIINEYLRLRELGKIKGIWVTCGTITKASGRWDFVITDPNNPNDSPVQFTINNAGQRNFVSSDSIPEGFEARPKYYFGSNNNTAYIELIITFEFETNETWPLSDDLVYKDVDYISTSQKFPIYANCNFTALEFLKECQLLKGLYTRQGIETNQIILEGLERLENKQGAQDLSDKLISINESEFTFDDWAKNNKFSFQEYSEKFNVDYGSDEINLSYINLPSNKALQSIFGTGSENIAGELLKVQQWSIKEGVAESNGVPIIYAKYMEVANQAQGIPRIRTIQFSEILELPNYQVLEAKLSQLRVVDADFLLSNLEFKRLNVNLPIYLRQAGKYFFIISADYDLNTSVLSAKLFKV